MARRGGGRPRAPLADSTLAYGQRVFMSGGCALCHSIGGTEARATVGPTLSHFKSRSTIARGNAREHARESHAVDRESSGHQARRAHAAQSIQGGAAECVGCVLWRR